MMELSQVLECGRKSLQRLRDRGLIGEPWHTRDVCMVLEAWNLEAAQTTGANPVNVERVRERLEVRRRTVKRPPPVEVPAEEEPQEAPPVVAGGGEDGREFDSIGASERGDEGALERKQRLEGDHLWLKIQMLKQDLLPREEVANDVLEVGQVVQRELGQFFRGIDGQYMLIEMPEARIAWGQEQLRLALERIVRELEGMYADAGV